METRLESDDPSISLRRHSLVNFVPPTTQIVQRGRVAIHEVVDHLLERDVVHLRVEPDHAVIVSRVTRQGNLAMFSHNANGSFEHFVPFLTVTHEE
jgi:hypothetical protein